MDLASKIALPVLQLIVIVGLAPLVKGFINKIEARFQNRRGASIFQP